MLYEQVTDNCITLHSGQEFDLAHPEDCEFAVEDIAHSLAHTCRFVGHCNSFYSVAEHSVLVSLAVQHAHIEALFHDAAEAFIGDVSSPLKRLFPQVKRVEERIQRAIFTRFGLKWPPPAEVKDADNRVIASEFEALMNRSGAGPLQFAEFRIKCLAPQDAKSLFLARYAELISH